MDLTGKGFVGFADKVAFGVVAYGADLRCLGGGMNVSAIQADPDSFALVEEELALFQHIGVHGKAVAVGLFDAGDHLEVGGDGGIAFLLCLLSECGVFLLKFLIFVVVGGAEQGESAGVVIYWIGGIDSDVLLCGTFFDEVMVKNLAMLLFLVGRKSKNLFQQIEAFFFCLSCGKGVAIACLRFSGKGAEKIFSCFALFKGDFPV